MKLRLLTLLGILLFTSGCYTQYRFVYEIDRSEPTNPSDYYCWECSENKSKSYDWSETKHTPNPNYKNNPWKPSKTVVEIQYKNYEVHNWYKKNYYIDRKDWFRGYIIWEPTLYSPYYGFRYNQWYWGNGYRYNHWYWTNGWRYGNHWYPKNNIVIINKNDNNKLNKSRRGGFGTTDYNKPRRDYFDGMGVTRSGSTKITKPRSTGRTTTVNPPTTRTTGRSSTVKSGGGSSNTRSTGRTTTKKKTRTE